MTSADPTQPAQPDRSLGELFSSLTSDLSTLMHQEVDLAREEVRVEARKAAKAGGAFGGAAVVGLLTGVALVMTLGFVLDVFLPAWAAFLIVTVVLGLVAAVLARQGRARLREVDPKPEKTMQTLKEDAQWLSEQRS